MDCFAECLCYFGFLRAQVPYVLTAPLYLHLMPLIAWSVSSKRDIFHDRFNCVFISSSPQFHGLWLREFQCYLIRTTHAWDCCVCPQHSFHGGLIYKQLHGHIRSTQLSESRQMCIQVPNSQTRYRTLLSPPTAVTWPHSGTCPNFTTAARWPVTESEVNGIIWYVLISFHIYSPNRMLWLRTEVAVCYQSHIPPHCKAVSHRVNKPQLTPPFSCWWLFGLFPVLSY